MEPARCHFCGMIVRLVHVHGHYQCPVCHTNALPCCDGDNCETNLLLNTQPSLLNGTGEEPAATAAPQA